MINNKIDELFQAINESEEYQDYLKIVKILKEDKELTNLIEEIKQLQKEATILEYQNNTKYKEIDNTIKEKLNILNNNPLYVEYKYKMDELNNIISTSSNMITKYLEEIV